MQLVARLASIRPRVGRSPLDRDRPRVDPGSARISGQGERADWGSIPDAPRVGSRSGRRPRVDPAPTSDRLRPMWIEHRQRADPGSAPGRPQTGRGPSPDGFRVDPWSIPLSLESIPRRAPAAGRCPHRCWADRGFDRGSHTGRCSAPNWPGSTRAGLDLPRLDPAHPRVDARATRTDPSQPRIDRRLPIGRPQPARSGSAPGRSRIGPDQWPGREGRLGIDPGCASGRIPDRQPAVGRSHVSVG